MSDAVFIPGDGNSKPSFEIPVTDVGNNEPTWGNAGQPAPIYLPPGSCIVLPGEDGFGNPIIHDHPEYIKKVDADGWYAKLTHVHKDYLTELEANGKYVPLGRTISAGRGMGPSDTFGKLDKNLVIHMANPQTVKVDSLNEAYEGIKKGHTHAVESSDSPYGRHLLRSNDTGGITLQHVNTKEIAAIQDGDDEGVYNPLRIGSPGGVIFPKDTFLESEYSSPDNTGWKLDVDKKTGASTLELSNLILRNNLQAPPEFEITEYKVRSINGDIILSDAAEVVSVSTITVAAGRPHRFRLHLSIVPPFVGDDLLLAKKFLEDGYESKVLVIGHNNTAKTIDVEMIDGDEPRVGFDYVRIGNTSINNPHRQGTVFIASSSNGSPYIDVRNGVNSFGNWGVGGTTRVRLGRLDNLGIPGVEANTFGLWAGSLADDKYILLTGKGQQMKNVPVELFSGAEKVAMFSASAGLAMRASNTVGAAAARRISWMNADWLTEPAWIGYDVGENQVQVSPELKVYGPIHGTRGAFTNSLTVNGSPVLTAGDMNTALDGTYVRLDGAAPMTAALKTPRTYWDIETNEWSGVGWKRVAKFAASAGRGEGRISIYAPGGVEPFAETVHVSNGWALTTENTGMVVERRKRNTTITQYRLVHDSVSTIYLEAYWNTANAASVTVMTDSQGWVTDCDIVPPVGSGGTLLITLDVSAGAGVYTTGVQYAKGEVQSEAGIFNSKSATWLSVQMNSIGIFTNNLAGDSYVALGRNRTVAGNTYIDLTSKTGNASYDFRIWRTAAGATRILHNGATQLSIEATEASGSILIQNNNRGNKIELKADGEVTITPTTILQINTGIRSTGNIESTAGIIQTTHSGYVRVISGSGNVWMNYVGLNMQATTGGWKRGWPNIYNNALASSIGGFFTNGAGDAIGSFSMEYGSAIGHFFSATKTRVLKEFIVQDETIALNQATNAKPCVALTAKASPGGNTPASQIVLGTGGQTCYAGNTAGADLFIMSAPCGTNATGPGTLSMGAGNGLNHHLWVDDGGLLRIASGFQINATNQGSSGTPVGTQTSSLKYKNLTKKGLSSNPIGHIKAAAAHIHKWKYQSKAYGDQEFEGLVLKEDAPETHRYGMDRTPEFPEGKVLNVPVVVADLMRAVVELHERVSFLEGQLKGAV